ncbi:MAG: hypothetical protein MRY57_01120 [Candidatus Pacebacteria bacterium]|nr:hypothetical protein [Candidatus Paceibacterota bacterium]
MKSLQKTVITALVFMGLLAGGFTAHAESKTNVSFTTQLSVVTQLLSVMETYPEFAEVFKPLLDDAIEKLIASIGTSATVEKKEYNKTEAKAPVKKYDSNKKTDSYKKDSYYKKDIEEKGDIDDIEAEPYESVDGKWKIGLDFENGSELVIYVYDVDSEEELLEKVQTEIKNKFNIDLSIDELESIIDVITD